MTAAAEMREILESAGITADVPDKLKCEQCGERTVDVIVTHLGSADNDRQCYPCFFASAARILSEMGGAEVTGE